MTADLARRIDSVRNYDLPTAITVLTTGTYTGLPSILSESFAQPTTLPDEVVLRTLEELDDVLRWRLNCVEVVPRRMRRYWIGKRSDLGACSAPMCCCVEARNVQRS